MDQWPETPYQKPLPPLNRRIPGRPPHKIKRYASENDGNRTRISRKGQINHCKVCGKSVHNQRGCPSKPAEQGSSARGSKTARGAKTIRGG